MFVDERCKTCNEFYTHKTIKNDQCKCMRKEQRSYKLQKKNNNGKYFSKLNEEIKQIQYEIFVKSLTRKV